MSSNEVHLFGEMDLNLFLSPDKLYKKASDIAECCGYVVSIGKESNKQKGTIEIYGEDCDDSLSVVNVLHYEDKTIRKIQKLVYRIGKYEYNKDNNVLIQVFEYINGDFKEIWNKKKEIEKLEQTKL